MGKVSSRYQKPDQSTPYLSRTLVNAQPRRAPSFLSVCSASVSSAAQQDDDVDEKQADEDEGEVDEELLQVPLGLRVHLDLGGPADGRLGHVLDPLHGGGGGG